MLEIEAEIISIPFKLSPQPIQYKKLRPGHFSWAEGEIKHEFIQPDEQGYITEKLKQTLKDDAENDSTCIINIGVGRGKTTAICDIIHHYAQQENYVVILASPFKKLVQRDHKHIEEKNGNYEITNYEILDNPLTNIKGLAATSKVHIITLNSLMLNPGEENLQITARKHDYCYEIWDYCKKNDKKVVFVFDEIHAGIHCFQEEFIFNLRSWKEVTHKCFILSATFTEPARIAIEYIAYLTKYKISILETERKKFPKQSNLHLYITDGKYSAHDLTLLDPLRAIVADAAANNKRVHIITAFKDMADKLAENDETGHQLLEAIKALKPNLVTGESKNDFDEKASNIGTTFYTGISLEKEDDILVLIMPSAESQFADKIGGIFSTGKIAISQAIARLRTNGNIHVFMPKPDLLIKGEYLKHVHNEIKGEIELYPEALHEPHDDEKQLELLKKFYYSRSQRGRVEKEIAIAEKEIKDQNWDERAPLNYPSLGSFILNKGMNFLIQRYASYGKGFSPYVLWAALNDQFENTTLNSITFVSHATEKLELNKENIIEQLLEHFGGEEKIKELIKRKNLRQAFGALLNQLNFKRLPGGNYTKKLKIYWEGKDYPSRYTPIPVLQAIVSVLYLVVQGQKVTATSELWVMNQIAKFKNKTTWDLELNPECQWYIRLEETRQEFRTRVENNNMVASIDLFDADFLFRCFEAVRGINNYDYFIKNRTFNFCRLNNREKIVLPVFGLTDKHFKKGGENIEKLKGSMFRAYYNYFTQFSFERRGAATIESFYDIPEKHFYQTKVKDTGQGKSKLQKMLIIKSAEELEKKKLERLKKKYDQNNQKVLDKVTNNTSAQNVDFGKLAIKQKELQKVLGLEDNTNFFVQLDYLLK